MDDTLKLKIAASLDLQTDAAADPEVARALDTNPEARDYARSLHTLDRALRKWPQRKRAEMDWEALAARIDARIVNEAKVRKGKGVSSDEVDLTAVPAFDDETTSRAENRKPMSDAQDDDDLAGLAALTRTSRVPMGPSVSSVLPSLSDAVDDSSSGIIDIKKLASMARAAHEEPVVEKPAETKAEPAPESSAAAKGASPEPEKKKLDPKKTDVMVTPQRAVATPAPVAEAPRKGGNTFVGLFGGIALCAGAFALYTNMSSPTAERSSADPMAAAPTAAAPTAEAPPTPTSAPPEPVAAAPVAQAAPSPESSPTASALLPSAATTESVVAAPTQARAPAPVEAAPAAGPGAAAHAPEEGRAAAQMERQQADHLPATARREVAARVVAPAARPQAAGRVAAGAAGPPAAPTPATATAPTVRAPVVAAAPATPPPAPAGRDRSIDDLINHAARGNAPAAPPVVAPAAELPERPTRSQITSVLSGLNGAVRSCANGQTGTAPVALVIANDGSVRSANVSGQFAGSSAGECISGVVRRAHFPPFRSPQVSLTYPFVILPPR